MPCGHPFGCLSVLPRRHQLAHVDYATGSAWPPVSCNDVIVTASRRCDQSHLWNRLQSARVDCGPEVSPFPRTPIQGSMAPDTLRGISPLHLLWVISRAMSGLPSKQTSADQIGTSAECQKRTSGGLVMQTDVRTQFLDLDQIQIWHRQPTLQFAQRGGFGNRRKFPR